jgi:hypothetical protein
MGRDLYWNPHKVQIKTCQLAWFYTIAWAVNPPVPMAKFNIALAILAVAAATPLLHAQFTASNEVDYSSGKYGEKITTDIYTDVISGEYVYKDWTGKLEVTPYERITGPGNVLPKIGLVGGKRRVIGFTQAKATNDGFGDVDLSVSYDAYHNDENGWDILVTGEVKFGTASASKNLGTGQDDYTPSVDISRTMGKYTPWVSFGYRWVGKPKGFGLLDYVYGSAGLTYDFNDQTNVTATFDTSEKESVGTNVDNDASLEFSHKLGQSWSVDLTGLGGLSTAAPAVELTGSVGYKF